MKKNMLILFFCSCLFFISCDNNKVYEEYVGVENYVWNKNVPVRFEFEITDTTALHNVYVDVRHANQYQYSNLWVFINSWAPTGEKSIDTLECNLADEKGKWLGSGLGDIWDTQILWKQNVRFSKPGKYSVECNQGMRTDNLVGIMDMGLRVELAENND